VNDAPRLRSLEDGEHSRGTTEVKQATAVGGDIRAVQRCALAV